jgi:hypothetical protein
MMVNILPFRTSETCEPFLLVGMVNWGARIRHYKVAIDVLGDFVVVDQSSSVNGSQEKW